MTPSNLTIFNSVREYQKHFNQAFNLASAAADQTYSSTQTIAGGLIICKNFTVNSAVVLTISNPTTIICQTFTNNGTITMSQVTETILGKYRTTDAPKAPDIHVHGETMNTVAFGATGPGTIGVGGSGGPSFGFGGPGGNGQLTTGSSDGINAYGAKVVRAKGWNDLGMAAWWPISYFRNPVLSQASGNNANKPYYTSSLAWQRSGGVGGTVLGAANNVNSFSFGSLGGSPGSFLEVFARVSINNSATGIVNAIGGAGASTSGAGGGGGGGGCIGFYAEGTLIQAGTLNVTGGAGGTISAVGAGGGGGGGIFLTAPTITNSGTNTIAGGALGAGGNNGIAGQSGVLIVEPYLRLWMPGEDDVVAGTRYAASN